MELYSQILLVITILIITLIPLIGVIEYFDQVHFFNDLDNNSNKDK